MTTSSDQPRNERRIINVKRKAGDQPIPLPPRPQVQGTMSAPTTPLLRDTGAPDGMRVGAPRQNPPHMRQRSALATSVVGSAPNGLQYANEQPSRRARNGSANADTAMNAPSLLSRLASTSSNGSGASRRTTPPAIPAKRTRTESAPNVSLARRSPVPDDVPAGGFSIRGAARRKMTEEDDLPSRSHSLLDRMQSDDDGWDAGGRRKKKKQKT
ncbi:hypothetical protein OBBRIDRAFT_512960 [Obba rivulosa]|uniref:Uncharacterized protein n=1 Tax=Obba rivulosa TaxID=1052685 RepID=A0A8E2AVB4_9APHY|nr:hypothetical protein OBBRIDRAFT_512960 [Obba rivulosa]